jgi:hypothetical protein
MTAAKAELAYDMGSGSGTEVTIVTIAEEVQALCQELESALADDGLGSALGSAVAHLADCPAALVNAMNEYKKIPVVQSDGCCVLGDLAGNLPVRVTEVWIDVVFGAMRNHPHIVSVQMHGCWAIANFVFNEEQGDLASQGVDFVLYAMRKFPDFEELQEHGCLAMGRLASIADCRRRIIAANGADVIRTAKQTCTDGRTNRVTCTGDAEESVLAELAEVPAPGIVLGRRASFTGAAVFCGASNICRNHRRWTSPPIFNNFAYV